MLNKTVWILGAGASKSATAGVFPLLREIPSAASEARIVTDWRGRPGFRVLQRYLARRFGQSLGPSSDVDLEAALTALDIDILVDGDAELTLARVTLVGVLRETFSRLHATGYLGNNEYRQLVSQLSPQDSVVTYNWDLLLDDALGRVECLGEGYAHPPENQYGRFLQELTGYGDGTISKLSPPAPISSWGGRRGFILKAHGSIDWYQCANSMCRNAGRVFPMATATEASLCAVCLEQNEPVIVPPTLNKRLRDVPAIRRIWNTAGKEVGCATHIAIWGYSLPPTDFFSDWLLRQAEPKQLQALTLINTSLVRGKKRRIFGREGALRFLSALRVDKTQCEIKLFETFADFRQQIELRDKYPELANAVRRVIGNRSAQPE